MREHTRVLHRPIPRHKPTEIYQPGMIEYKLNPAEMELLGMNRLDLIPHASQRGLSAPPSTRRVLRQPTSAKRADRTPKAIVQSITAAMLIEHIQAGLTNREIGTIYGISASTIGKLMQKFDLGSRKGHPRQFRGGRRNKKGAGYRANHS